MGAYEANKSIAPCTDQEYLELIQPYLDKAEIGMFMGVKNANKENIELGAKYGLKFLRIGANAGDGAMAKEGIRLVKANGMKCRYSLMKAYILSPEDLAAEAKMLEECGLDEITIMDSAGTMMPHQVTEYVKALKSVLKIPVAFHGHNNLGLSVANAMAAMEAGAEVFDAGLLGMARSAGNCATELLIATFQRLGYFQDIDLYKLLHFYDEKLIPAMGGLRLSCGREALRPDPRPQRLPFQLHLQIPDHRRRNRRGSVPAGGGGFQDRSEGSQRGTDPQRCR